MGQSPQISYEAKHRLKFSREISLLRLSLKSSIPSSVIVPPLENALFKAGFLDYLANTRERFFKETSFFKPLLTYLSPFSEISSFLPSY